MRVPRRTVIGLSGLTSAPARGGKTHFKGRSLIRDPVVMIDAMSYAALAISVMALLFTVLSFWWLHARPGLQTYEPTTWAAYVGRDRSAIRLPLVLHNTGASTLVLIGLRLRFAEGGELMAWEWTRTRVDPKDDDI